MQILSIRCALANLLAGYDVVIDADGVIWVYSSTRQGFDSLTRAGRLTQLD